MTDESGLTKPVRPKRTLLEWMALALLLTPPWLALLWGLYRL